MRFHAITLKGTQRTQNQDTYLTEKIGSFFFFAVADGLGGLHNGEKASDLAISTIEKELKRDNIDPKDILIKANEAIQQKAKQNQSIMATTIVLCRIEEDTGEVIIAHVGDSRAYLIHKGLWRTKDHSPVQDLVNLGILTEDDAFGHPERHRMAQALGIKDNITIDLYKTTMQEGNILLCTDGLHNYLRDREIQAIVTKNPPEKACDLLVKQARKLGSTDDITIIVVQLQPLPTKTFKQYIKTTIQQ
jgi:protein phosphatase